MAIRDKTLKYMQKMIKNFNGISMCELGSQKIYCKPGFNSAKDYFQSKGVNHTSIDINGQFDSLKLNLNERIELQQFDVVTNLGTSEHVSNHKMCFDNIHNLCKVGGIMIHVVPAEGSWLHHKCFRRYTVGFFKKLSEKRDYEILSLIEEKGDGKNHIYCTLRRKI